ncbi:hypothetical protein AAMO2058_001288900 [Amorphochlora amoebiformis]
MRATGLALVLIIPLVAYGHPRRRLSHKNANLTTGYSTTKMLVTENATQIRTSPSSDSPKATKVENSRPSVNSQSVTDGKVTEDKDNESFYKRQMKMIYSLNARTKEVNSVIKRAWESFSTHTHTHVNSVMKRAWKSFSTYLNGLSLFDKIELTAKAIFLIWTGMFIFTVYMLTPSREEHCVEQRRNALGAAVAAICQYRGISISNEVESDVFPGFRDDEIEPMLDHQLSTGMPPSLYM